MTLPIVPKEVRYDSIWLTLREFVSSNNVRQCDKITKLTLSDIVYG